MDCVMGEDEVERTIEREQASSSRKKRGNKKRSETSARRGGKVVTIEDVKKADIRGRGYDLCVSHALFKMYKRRFGSLYFVEGDHSQTRAFWVNRSGGEAFRIVEMELKFMYDAVFSKFSNEGFTKWGMAVRILNTILMGMAGFLILGDRKSEHAERMVTYIVISVAFVVEVIQICRVIVSDWTRVHLICAYIVESRHRESHADERWRICGIPQWCRLQVIKITMVVLGKFQDFIVKGNQYLSEVVKGKRYLSKFVRGDRYWSNQIPQHCLIETWLNWSPIMCKTAGLFPKPERSIVRWYTQIWHVNNVPVEDDLKDFIFEILKKACSEKYKSEECRQNVYNFEKDLFQGETDIQEVLKPHVNLEEVILIWHIATTLCDKQTERARKNKSKKKLPQKNGTGEKLEQNVKLSRILSKYCAYLLMSRPHLLPLHPKMARIAYMQLVNKLVDTLTLGCILQKNPYQYLLGCKYNDDLLGSGAKLAHQLLKKQEGDMWRLLAEYWGKLVIYMAVYNKSVFHAECLAAGGEFLSLVWVLLAHMGCGEQSDSAVTKKVEMQSDKELAVAERTTGLDPAAMQRTLAERENDLAATKKDLEDRGKELDAVKKVLKDRENDLAAKEKDLSDREKHLAAMEKDLIDRNKEGLSNPEEELAATKKTVSDLQEEVSATRKILRDREEDFAAMKKNLLLRKGNFE